MLRHTNIFNRHAELDLNVCDSIDDDQFHSFKPKKEEEEEATAATASVKCQSITSVKTVSTIKQNDYVRFLCIAHANQKYLLKNIEQRKIKENDIIFSIVQ